MRRLVVLLTALASLSSVASAYYHWTFFTGRGAPFVAKRLRFDLAALPDSTVSFFIAKNGPAKLVDGDNFPALVSQIRRAGETWNVPGSALKVKFGGFQDKPFNDILSEQVTPGIDVVFNDELPPGVLAYSDPLTYNDLGYLGVENGPAFAPIVRSRLQLASDLTARGQASYSDLFFQTMVHEFGHTLGLQHSMTGSAMATSITRGTSKAAPLAADDVAGISSLYPTAQFLANMGAIEGRVSVARVGVNLASVVAISLDGVAVGAMSLPDGSYRIEGLPAGDYLVYAHPLPPAQPGEAEPAGIISPRDLQHVTFPAAAEFQTRFYPHATDWHEATRIHVDAGKTASLIDFELQPMSGTGIYNLRMFGYLGPQKVPVHAPPLGPGFYDYLAFSAFGAQVAGNTAILPGLQLSAIGEAATLLQQTLQKAGNVPEFLYIGAKASAVGRVTPVSVAVTVGENLYVLPSAFSVVPTKHPLLTSVTGAKDEQGNWLATLVGENLDASTRVTFDGADALSVKAHSDGTLTVVAPPATGQQHAAVAALSAGQTSWQLQDSASPAFYSYDAPADPSFALSPGWVFAGTNVMLEIQGSLTNFLKGKTAVGFGTSDIVVRQSWVLGPERLLVNISIDPKAKLGAVPVTISTGLQLVTLGVQLQVQAPEAKQTTLLLPIVNDATGLPGAPAGSTISIQATGVPTEILGWQALVNGVRSPVTRSEDGRLLVPIAFGIEAGPRPIQLVAASGPAIPPVIFQIDSQPPSIAFVSGPANLVASAQQRLRGGDRVAMVVSNLLVTNAGDGMTPTASDIEVFIAGVAQRVELVEEQETAGTYRLEFVLSAATPAGDAQPATVRVGTRVSSAAPVAIAAPADVIE